MKKVLLYPGAFNPPHLGHVLAVEIAVASMPFDEVWIMPSGKREDKIIDTNYDDRRTLGKLFVEYLASQITIPVTLITAELDETKDRYTSEILSEIKSKDGNNVIQLIGMDGFAKLYPKIQTSNEKYLVLKRPGYDLPPIFIPSDNFHFLNETGSDISSTKIRDYII